MDDKLKEVLETGSPVDKSESMMGEMKGYYKGDKASFVFTCMACGGGVTTKNEYSYSDDYIRDSIKIEIFYRLSSMLRSTLYRIPFMGRFIYDRASRKLDRREDKSRDSKRESARIKAFDEIKDQFKPCTKCGKYACPSCYSDGLCGMCNELGGAQNEVLANFDKQIEDQEKMTAKMIEEHPENRETYEKQLEEQKKQIEASKKEFLDNFGKES